MKTTLTYKRLDAELADCLPLLWSLRTPATGKTGTNYAHFTFQVEDNGSTTNGGLNLDPTPKTLTMNVT